MRRKYAKWWNLDALLPEQMDEIRQCVESGSTDEVALVAVDCDQKAEEPADHSASSAPALPRLGYGPG